MLQTSCKLLEHPNQHRALKARTSFCCSERSQLFGYVTCAYLRKLFINVLQVADYLFLAVAIMVLGFSLCWCLLHNHSLQKMELLSFIMIPALMLSTTTNG